MIRIKSENIEKACLLKKIFIENDIKNADKLLKYSENYGIMHHNKQRECLKCIKQTVPLRRENGRRNTSKDVLFLSLFLLAFEKKVIVSDCLVKTLAIVQNI